MVEAAGVCLGYGAHPVLEQADVCIRMGEFWFLLGPNGTGKTTFLKGLLGMLPLQAGTVWMHPALAQRNRLGFVPQRVQFNPTLPSTVREFVLLGMVGIKASRGEQRERIEQALAQVGLQGMAKRNYWALSEGQRQRVLIARALARRPLLLVMDEPTTGLDVAAERTLLDYVAKLHREDHLTVLFVSHHLATAAHYGTHVALFRNRGLQTGPVATLLNSRNLKHVYGMDVENAPDGIATALS